jgi:hypothetical protein
MFLKICLFLYEIHRPFPSDCEDCEMRCKFVTLASHNKTKVHIIITINAIVHLIANK